MKLNPIGHDDNKADILTVYDVTINGLNTLLYAWQENNYEKFPNYFLIHPKSFYDIQRAIFNQGLYAPEIEAFQNIPFLRSRDVKEGLIQLV